MKLSKHTRILIIGGHLTPALAILGELRHRGYDNLQWAGARQAQTSDRRDSFEYQVIVEQGIPFTSFRSGKLWRKWTLPTLFKGLFNLLLIPYGFVSAVVIMARLRPALVLSFGGYMAVPLVLAAKLLRIKVVTHEQTVVKGLANNLIAMLADYVLVSWRESLGYFPKDKSYWVGNPVRTEVQTVSTNNIQFANQLPVIYVTGGNQGANTINRRLLPILPQLLTRVNVIHQTGSSTLTNDYQKAVQVKASLSPELQNRYHVVENIYGHEIGEVLHKADLVVSRSGANTICELMLLGKLSVLIPIPWSSHNEQLRNAELMASTGLSLILKQYDAMPPDELQQAISTGLEHVTSQTCFNGEPLSKAQEQARGMVNINASLDFVNFLEQRFN